MTKISIILPLLFITMYASEITSIKVACDNKIAAACYQLALLYDKGQGLSKDTKKAKAYYLEACDYGYEKACTSFEHIKTEN